MHTLIQTWPGAILEGRFLKRYKRFFADIDFAGATVIAHVANTGSLKSCLHEGGRALMLGTDDPARKLKFSLQALETPWGAWIGVNTQWPNLLVKNAFVQKAVRGWDIFATYKPEHKISKETRLDGLLVCGEGKRQRFIEIKNVTLAEGDCAGGRGTAVFPDAVTERGQKHLRELTTLVTQGFEAEMVYVVQRTDCVKFRVADEIDPDYARALRAAMEAGVKVSVWPVELGPEGLRLRPDLPLQFIERLRGDGR